MAKLMLEEGAKVNNEEEGCNGLGQAASHRHTSTIAFLLDHSAKAISQRHMRPRTSSRGTQRHRSNSLAAL